MIEKVADIEKEMAGEDDLIYESMKIDREPLVADCIVRIDGLENKIDNAFNAFSYVLSEQKTAIEESVKAIFKEIVRIDSLENKIDNAFNAFSYVLSEQKTAIEESVKAIFKEQEQNKISCIKPKFSFKRWLAAKMNDWLSDDVKKHWYCFTFMDALEEGGSATGSAYTGYETKNISMVEINHNKTNAKLSQNAVLLAVSYLGYMTRSQVIGSLESDNKLTASLQAKANS